MTTDDLSMQLGRIRESALFYLKMDFAMLGGGIALIALFEMSPDEIFVDAPQYLVAIQVFAVLITYGLIFEFLLISAMNQTSNPDRRIAAKMKFLSIIQLGGHVLLIGVIVLGITAFTAGQQCVLDSFRAGGDGSSCLAPN